MKTCKIEPFRTIQALYRSNKPFKAKPEKEYLKISDNVEAQDLEVFGEYINGLRQAAERYQKPVQIGRFMPSMDGERYPYVYTGDYIKVINESTEVPKVVREVYAQLGKETK